MLSFLLTIKSLTITSNSELNLTNKEYNLIIDTSIDPKNIIIKDDNKEFTLELENKEKINQYIEMLEKYSNIPSDISNVVDHLENLEKTEEDLKSGNVSFLIFFTNNIKNIPSDNVKIFLSSDKELATKLECPFPGVYGYNKDENVTYRMSFRGFKEDIATVMTPILKELTVESLKIYDESLLPKFFLFHSEDVAFDYNLYKPIASKYRKDLKIGTLAYKKEKPSLTHFGVTEEHLPVVVCVHDKKKFRIINLTPEKLDSDFGLFIKGELPAYEQSANEPEKNDQPLKIITRNGYKKYFYLNASDKNDENDKPAFVAITSPHCRFCTDLKPILKDFAEKNKNIMTGDIDLSVNDFPEFNVTGYPTICLVYKGKINYYQGERTVKAFEKFIAEIIAKEDKESEETIDSEIKEEL